VLVDNSKANASISKTGDHAEGLGSKFKKGAKVAGKWALGLGVAAAAVGTAMFTMATKTASALDEIHKGSSKMGVSTDAYQEMDYWAGQNGLSAEDLEKAVGRLNTRIGDAAGGNKKYSDALTKLGINMDDVREGTISTEEVFAKSIQSLSEMENGQQKAAMASELFGTKLGRELLPALEDGSLSFEDAKKKAEELGIVLSEESVIAGAKFTDTMDDMKRGLGAVGQKIGIQLMPTFQKMMDWVMANLPEIKKVAAKVFDAIRVAVGKAKEMFEALKPTLVILYDFVVWAFPIVATVITEVFKVVSDVVSGVTTVFKDITGAIKTAYDWLTFWDNKEVKEKNITVNEKKPTSNRKGGTHAAGLPYVPYDGYIAELHKGERVLSRDQATGGNVNHTGTIRIEGVNDSGQMVAVSNLIMNNLARQQRRNK